MGITLKTFELEKAKMKVELREAYQAVLKDEEMKMPGVSSTSCGQSGKGVLLLSHLLNESPGAGTLVVHIIRG